MLGPQHGCEPHKAAPTAIGRLQMCGQGPGGKGGRPWQLQSPWSGCPAQEGWGSCRKDWIGCPSAGSSDPSPFPSGGWETGPGATAPPEDVKEGSIASPRGKSGIQHINETKMGWIRLNHELQQKESAASASP